MNHENYTSDVEAILERRPHRYPTIALLEAAIEQLNAIDAGSFQEFIAKEQTLTILLEEMERRQKASVAALKEEREEQIRQLDAEIATHEARNHINLTNLYDYDCMQQPAIPDWVVIQVRVHCAMCRTLQRLESIRAELTRGMTPNSKPLA